MRSGRLEDAAGHTLRLAGAVMESQEAALCIDSQIFRWRKDGDSVELLSAGEELQRLEKLAQGTLRDIELKRSWRVAKLPGRPETDALLVCQTPGREPAKEQIAGLYQLAAMAGLKISAIKAEEKADLERFKYTRWFETLDSQLRVLERERQKLAMLVNKTEAGSVVFGSDYLVRWVNPAIANRFGCEQNPSHLAGRHCRNFCGSDSVCDECPVKNVLEKGNAFHHERTHISGEETRHYYVSGFPLRSPDASIEEVLVTVQDLTDLETLRKSRERYETLFQRSADAIFMVDPKDYSIIMANREAERLTGKSEEDLRGLSILEVHPESEHEEMTRYLGRLAAGEAGEGLETEVHSPGEPTTCNTCGLLFDLDESPALMVEYRNVTQLRKLQTELVRADHLIALGTMNAGIAHEFKNRLAPLRAFAQMLTIPGRDANRLLSYGPIIVREVDRLSSLVGDVLEYARPQEPRRHTANLASLTGEVIQDLLRETAEAIEEADVDCRVRVEDNVDVSVDADQYRRIIINLFKNAVEACATCKTNQGMEISVSVNRSGGTGRVVIADNGCGIEQNQLDRIFEPFFTTKGPRGTGLGMCIVKSLVEANQGELAIDSRLNQGTTIQLSFPLAQGSAEETREAA